MSFPLMLKRAVQYISSQTRVCETWSNMHVHVQCNAPYSMIIHTFAHVARGVLHTPKHAKTRRVVFNHKTHFYKKRVKHMFSQITRPHHGWDPIHVGVFWHLHFVTPHARHNFGARKCVQCKTVSTCITLHQNIVLQNTTYVMFCRCVITAPTWQRFFCQHACSITQCTYIWECIFLQAIRSTIGFFCFCNLKMMCAGTCDVPIWYIDG